MRGITRWISVLCDWFVVFFSFSCRNRPHDGQNNQGIQEPILPAVERRKWQTEYILSILTFTKMENLSLIYVQFICLTHTHPLHPKCYFFGNGEKWNFHVDGCIFRILQSIYIVKCDQWVCDVFRCRWFSLTKWRGGPNGKVFFHLGCRCSFVT